MKEPGNVRINYSIVLVSDMARSVKYYRDTLGIPLKFESPEWTEFKTDGATLALHLCAASPADSRTPNAESAGLAAAAFRSTTWMTSMPP
ncbi:MAG: VOC family protein [Pirellulaceae bacterium]